MQLNFCIFKPDSGPVETILRLPYCSILKRAWGKEHTNHIRHEKVIGYIFICCQYLFARLLLVVKYFMNT
jgi:hypothetical protein